MIKTRLTTSLLLAGLAVLPGQESAAGTLYRCEGADGRLSYSGSRIPGATCRVATTYNPARERQRTQEAAPAPVAPPAAAVDSSSTGADKATAAATSKPASTVTATPSSRRVSGQIYTYTRNGVTYASSTRPAGVSAAAMRTIPYTYMETCFACGASPRVNFGTLRLNTAAFRNEIAEASRMHGVEESIIRAIMHAESAYNPNALSHAGAQGLMQLMPATARRFGVTNAYDPRQNIQGGVRYLAWLLRRFNGDLTLAAAGYNAGEGAVDRHKGVPPYRETRQYVERVRVLADRYRSHGTGG